MVVRPGPAFSVFDVCRGWVRGFRSLGHEVADVNFDDRLDVLEQAELGGKKAFTTENAIKLAQRTLLADAYQFWPDLIVVISAFFISPWVLALWRDRGHRVVLIHTESPYEEERQLRLADYADLNILNDPTNLASFPPGTSYLPHAYDPTVHFPHPPDPELVTDFCFVGTGYESRLAFFEAVDFGDLNVGIAGNWGQLAADSLLRKYLLHDIEACLANDDTARLYGSTAMSANLYRREASTPEGSIGWAMGPREVELAACGTFFLRDPRPESDQVLPMLPTFTGPAEFSELLGEWVHHPERADRAAAARDAVKDRTFEANAKVLLELIG